MDETDPTPNEWGSRVEFHRWIEELGFTTQERVTKKTDVLFVGPEWEGDGNRKEHIPDSYFKLLKNHNIECVLLVKNLSQLGMAQNTYFNQTVKPYKPEVGMKLDNPPPNSRFFSSKYLVEGGKEYLSYAHWKKGLDKSDNVLDNDDYWKESEHFYIYE